MPDRMGKKEVGVLRRQPRVVSPVGPGSSLSKYLGPAYKMFPQRRARLSAVCS